MPDTLTAIAAVARNGVIGVGGALPWHIPEDMRHFKQATMGGALVMGRATYQSFGARPLPGRALFVVSRTSPVILPSSPVILPSPPVILPQAGSPDGVASETGLNRADSASNDRLGISNGSENPLGAPISDTQSTKQPSGGSFEASSGPPEPETRIAPGVTWCRSLDDALNAAQASGRPVFVAGGEAVYRAAWPLLTDLDLTLVDAEPAGDRFFPVIDGQEWQETFREPHDGFSFVRYRRRL